MHNQLPKENPQILESDYFCILSQFNKLKLNQKKTKYYPKICPENFTYVSDKNKFFI